MGRQRRRKRGGGGGNRSVKAGDERAETATRESTSQLQRAESQVHRRVGARVAIFVAVLAFAGIVLVVWLARQRSPIALQDFPAPHLSAAGPVVSVEEFVGAESCGECHADQYAMWSGSTHGRAGGAPSPETVIAPFNRSPIRFRDAVVIPSVDQGTYTFTVRQEGREDIVYTVDGVIGRGHMVGGGTQGFVSEFPDGSIRFLPFDYIRAEGVWFCNTITRADVGWVPITSEIALADCSDWPPARALGTHRRFANCQECHGSQILIEYQTNERSFATHVASYTVNCESCHGPGREHVQRARLGTLSESSDIRIGSFATVDTDSSLGVCFQCHAVKTVLAEGYLPGESFVEHYSTKLELIGSSPLFPDGRVKTFAYQQNHLYSDCYLSGSMTCVDCHDPHSNDYRDIYGQKLANRFADEQCLDCHASKATDVSAHTNHPPDSPGSQCVSCHMPYLQHPELGSTLRFSRSDHTIPIPRPAFDDSLGVRTACANCHAEMTVPEMQATIEEWYGEIKPHKDIVRGLLSLGAVTDRVSAAASLLPRNTKHAIGMVAGLGAFVEEYLQPDMPFLEEDVVNRLRILAIDEDLDVRAVALSALHMAQGEVPSVRAFLVDRIRASSPEAELPLRRRWAVTLGYHGDLYRVRGQLQAAIVIYRKALAILPEDPNLLGQLADTYGNLGEFDLAVATFSDALDVDPNRALTWVNFGVTLESRDMMSEAATAYRRALEVNPRESLALFNLGNYHLRRNEFEQATDFYTQAVTADPGLSRGHYFLARSLIQLNRLDDAEAAARRAVEFDPADESARSLLRQLESR